MNVGKLLEMAGDLHRPPVDEVARNGAFGIYFGQRCFPDAPLQSQFAGTLPAFPGSPPPKVVRTLLQGNQAGGFPSC